MTKRKKLYIILAVVLVVAIAAIIIVVNLPPKIDEISGLPCISWWDAWKIEAGMTKEEVIEILGDEYGSYRSFDYPDECMWPLPDGRGLGIYFVPEDGFYDQPSIPPRTEWRAVIAIIYDECDWGASEEEIIFNNYSVIDGKEVFSFPD